MVQSVIPEKIEELSTEYAAVEKRGIPLFNLSYRHRVETWKKTLEDLKAQFIQLQTRGANEKIEQIQNEIQKTRELLNHNVTMQWFQRRDDSKLCGIDEAIAVLHTFAIHPEELVIEALHDGDIIQANEPVLKVTGKYENFGFLESVIDGILARRTSVCTNVYNVLKVAGDIPVFSMADRQDDYLTQIGDGYATYVAGIKKVSTDAQGYWYGGKGMGTMPHALIQICSGDVYDKGPLLAAYYAMKAVRDNHMMGDYQIRFIVGGNEESGSAGVEYYFQKLKKPQPDFGFSPDAEFPLIFAEKGIMNFEVKKKINLKHVDSIKGGVASNSVIEQCVVVLDYDRDFIKFLVDHKYDADYVQSSLDKLTVTFHGKAAHGSTPEQGFNAGMQAIKCIANYFSDKDLLHLYDKYKNVQGYDLEAFGNSEEMGHNTLNVGIINYEDKQFSMIVNFRYVDKCDVDDLLFHIKEHSKPFTVNVLGNSKLLYYPKESELVLTLLRAYQYETGDFKSQPMAIGGGTYAKEANNVVAFGMEFPGWDSHMHSPGEQAKKADLFKSMSIYARAIIELGRLLENKNEN